MNLTQNLTQKTSALKAKSQKKIQNGVLICEEVFLDKDGNTLWRSSATAACSSRLSLSLQHGLTVSENYIGKNDLKTLQIKDGKNKNLTIIIIMMISDILYYDEIVM